MAIKKITLTEDHIKLIKNLKFETFDNGYLFSTERINSAIAEIEKSESNLAKFGELRDALLSLKEQLEIISDKKECYAWGINQWSLWGGNWALEDIALIIGQYDKFIRGTEESPLGKQFPKPLEDYMWKLYDDFSSNMDFILSLVQFFLDKGGLTAGVYKCKTSDMEWERIGDVPETPDWDKVLNSSDLENKKYEK